MLTTVALVGCVVFLVFLLGGMIAILWEEDPPGLFLPRPAQISFMIAILGAIIAFMAAVSGIAIHILCP